MRKPNVSIDLPMIAPKFKVGDHILIKVPSVVVTKGIWVAKIEAVEHGSYIVQDLTSGFNFKTRITHLFDKMLTKISTKNIDKTIKAVKILYNEIR